MRASRRSASSIPARSRCRRTSSAIASARSSGSLARRKRFSAASRRRDVLVEQTTRHSIGMPGEARAGDAVTAGAGQLPAGRPAHVDGVDLPVALHRLADCRRPGGVDRPQPLAEVDLVGIEGNDVAGVSRRERSSGRHV
jgi:hypothetical protein